MSFNNKRYKDFERKLNSIQDNEVVDEKKINEIFNDLLSVLPNDGKLYKYKSLKKFHIDELEKKYIYLSSAKDLNDNKDCAFNANSLVEIDKLVNFYSKNNNFRKVLSKGLYFTLLHNHKNISLEIIEDYLSYISNVHPIIGRLRFNAFCESYRLSNEEKQKVATTIQLYADENQNNVSIGNSIRNLHEEIQNMRKWMHVLSFTTSFKKDSMWAYYCENKGICIEYDFTKIEQLGLKRKFINTQKVRYGIKKKFSYVNIMKAQLSNNSESSRKVDEMIMAQHLTKDKSWSAEEEWRMFAFIAGNEDGFKLYADIISAIYIDYSILNYKKTKQIIRLAKENHWKIFVRYFDEYEVEYMYDTIETIKQYVKKRSLNLVK